MEEKRKIVEQWVKNYYLQTIKPCYDMGQKWINQNKNYKIDELIVEFAKKENLKTSEIYNEILQLALNGLGEALLLCYSDSRYSENNDWERLINKYPNDDYPFFNCFKNGCSIIQLQKRIPINSNKKFLAYSKLRKNEMAKLFEDDAEKKVGFEEILRKKIFSVPTYDIVEQAKDIINQKNTTFEAGQILIFNKLYNDYKKNNLIYYSSIVKQNPSSIADKEKPKATKTIQSPKSRDNADVKMLKLNEKKKEQEIIDMLRILKKKEDENIEYATKLKKYGENDFYKQKYIFCDINYSSSNDDTIGKIINDFISEIVRAEKSKDRDRFFQLSYRIQLVYVKTAKTNAEVKEIILKKFKEIVKSNNQEDEISKILNLILEVDLIDFVMIDIDLIEQIGPRKFGIFISKLYDVLIEKNKFLKLLYTCLESMYNNKIIVDYIESIANIAWERKQIEELYGWIYRKDMILADKFLSKIIKRSYGLQDEIKAFDRKAEIIEKEIYSVITNRMALPLSNLEEELVKVNLEKENIKDFQEHIITKHKQLRDALHGFGIGMAVAKKDWNEIVRFNPDKHICIDSIQPNENDPVKVLTLGVKSDNKDILFKAYVRK